MPRTSDYIFADAHFRADCPCLIVRELKRNERAPSCPECESPVSWVYQEQITNADPMPVHTSDVAVGG
jgi:hypothetical protein